MKNLIKKHSFIFPMLALLVIGLTASALVWKATTPEQVVAETAPVEASTIAWTDTPAAKAIDKTFATLPPAWTARGNQLKSVTPPFPLSCMTDGLQPSYSVSQQFNNGLTISVSAFTAGAGAPAMDAQIKASSKCVGNNTYVLNEDLSGVGAQATIVHATRGAARSQTVVFRRGDMVGYVLADGGSAVDPAKAVDAALKAAMGGQCVNESSTPAEASRSLWTGVTFVGWQKPTEVTIPKRPLPVVTDAKAYAATPIPAELASVEEYVQPEKPEYPVWPLMPDALQVPTVPVAPAAEATTSSTINIRVPDEKGPGCGWDFTGTVKPDYDATAIDAANKELKATAVAALNKGADDWGASVTAYWKSVSAFRKSADAYEKYRASATAVAAQWEPIRKSWDTYYANLALHEKSVAERDAFLKEQESASKSYDEEVKRCEAPMPTPTPTPTSAPTASPNPSASATPSPSPTPTATVEAKPEVREGCPAVRPGILDENAPDIFPKPTEPANPIPADKR